MSLFSEMLARFVDSKSIKIYQLANLCGIERSWLQKMLTGKRKPADQEQVMNLSQALALTYTETQQLMNAYRILEMGEENWLRRNSVLKLLKSFRIDEIPCRSKLRRWNFRLLPAAAVRFFILLRLSIAPSTLFCCRNPRTPKDLSASWYSLNFPFCLTV